MEVDIATNRIDSSGEKSNNEENNVDDTTEGTTTEHRKQRERRIKSPNTTSMLLALEDPASASSSSWSTQAVNDTTFEPTIEMMVNDFDDEQTLNEEEALAESEQQDPHDEIATLREESEMPIEELLAKYQSLSQMSFPPTIARKKKKKQKHAKSRENKEKTCSNIEQPTPMASNLENPLNANDEEKHDVDEIKNTIDIESENSMNGDICEQEEHSFQDAAPFVTVAAAPSRSYLLDLYPDQKFDVTSKSTESSVLPLEALYGGDIQSESEDEPELDPDYVKKTIMVGSAYQATIPIGLSQYGDVLPYENEDKLIWEPSQVSEREVEEYLLMAREIKPTLCEDEAGLEIANGEDTNAGVDTYLKSLNGGYEHEAGNVVKDNEQALHLLVQCGYDFKEALRRKRLNAVPLTGNSMSIWSEEECQKFEEGIQKFGKDFLRIRQNQVRTRTMRELVLFYYLWKKSERRDHEFANADTVDHMDIYLNESGNNAIPNGCQTSGANVQLLPATNTRARSNSTGNISIMALSQSHATAQVLPNNILKSGGNRKRGTTGNSASQLMTAGVGVGVGGGAIANEVQKN